MGAQCWRRWLAARPFALSLRWLQAGSAGAVTAGHPQICPAFPTDAPFRMTEPSAGPAEPRPAWKALGRQLLAEPQGSSSDQLRRSFILAEPSGLLEPGGREGWSSSLPRPGRSAPAVLPRRVSHSGEVGAGSPLPTPPSTEGRDAQAVDGIPHPTAGLFPEPLGNGGQQGPKHPALVADRGLPGGWGAAGSPLTAPPRCFSRHPADTVAGSTAGARSPSCVCPRGAAQGARVPSRAGK